MGEDVFTRLVKKYRESVYRLAYCYMKSRADAEDITQEAFLRLYIREAGFDTDEQAKAWLMTVTANRARDLLRTHWYRFSVPLENAAELAAPDVSDNSAAAAIMKLRPAIRGAVYLHYIEGYSVKETAVILKCSETAVTTRLQRGREQLRRLLADEEKGGVS